MGKGQVTELAELTDDVFRCLFKVTLIDKVKPERQEVKWMAAQEGQLKFNVDRALSENSGEVGSGGILRTSWVQ